MALIDHIDGPNRDIYLDASTMGVDVHPIDVYKEMRTLRRTDESLRKFDIFLVAKGHESKGGGKYTEMYVIEMGGTRIIPYDADHELVIIGTIITDDGQSGVACFDRSPLSATTVVDINYQPLQVEVIEIASGSALTQAEHDHLMGIDLEIVQKMTYNKVTAAGDIITVYEDDGTAVWKRFDLSGGGRVEV